MLEPTTPVETKLIPANNQGWIAWMSDIGTSFYSRVMVGIQYLKESPGRFLEDSHAVQAGLGVAGVASAVSLYKLHGKGIKYVLRILEDSWVARQLKKMGITLSADFIRSAARHGYITASVSGGVVIAGFLLRGQQHKLKSTQETQSEQNSQGNHEELAQIQSLQQFASVLQRQTQRSTLSRSSVNRPNSSPLPQQSQALTLEAKLTKNTPSFSENYLCGEYPLLGGTIFGMGAYALLFFSEAQAKGKGRVVVEGLAKIGRSIHTHTAKQCIVVVGVPLIAGFLGLGLAGSVVPPTQRNHKAIMQTLAQIRSEMKDAHSKEVQKITIEIASYKAGKENRTISTPLANQNESASASSVSNSNFFASQLSTETRVETKSEAKHEIFEHDQPVSDQAEEGYASENDSTPVLLTNITPHRHH